QPPKTSGNSLSSSRWDQPQGERQGGYDQPNEINVITSINGPKTTSFSTQSAPLGPSLRSWRIGKMRYEADLAVRVANERF
ncbi:hypothetical protein, partial [Planktotalea frisia]|uniref:hypothetical protein n=1 Tax=Planktotalea frisia TaxID=696762 RepID=UPI001C31E417